VGTADVVGRRLTPKWRYLKADIRFRARGDKISHEYLQCAVGLEQPPPARALAVALRRQ
jgi:hypothetical protein